jgi:DNA helicase-2/ATP-dependent DNA helicase PcrA
MTRAMNTLILTRAHYRRRYGNDAPEMSIPSRFLEEVPSPLVENLSSNRAPAWAGQGYGNRGFGAGRQNAGGGDFAERHYNYEDESQETTTSAAAKGAVVKSNKPFTASWMTANARNPAATAKDGGAAGPGEGSIDNIAKFFGGKVGVVKPGGLARPSMDVPAPTGAANLKKGQRVRHSKYGEGTVLLRDGEGEDAKVTVMFARHGMKKLMEKFANLQVI